MKTRMNTNTKYILLLFALCAVLPHAVLLLLKLDLGLSPIRTETYTNFFVCQWIPFWLTFLSYVRVQKQDDFSLLPAIFAAVILVTYFPVFPRHSVMTMLLTVSVILLVELSALLKKAEASGNKALAGIAADRSALRACFYWTVVILCVVHISCEACTYERTVVSPFQLLPVPGILLFAVFRQQQKQPPALWSLAVMLATLPLAFYLAAIGPMEQFKGYHLACLGLGYAVLFLMLTVYNIDRWKK